MKSIWWVVMPSGARWGIEAENRAEAEAHFQRLVEPRIKPEERGEWKLVPDEELGEAPDRCDFCLASGPQWELTSKEFMITGPVTQRVSADWLACGECLDLLRSKRITDLITRCVTANILLHPDWVMVEEQIRDTIRNLVSQFRKGWNGASEPNPKVEKDK